VKNKLVCKFCPTTFLQNKDFCKKIKTIFNIKLNVTCLRLFCLFVFVSVFESDESDTSELLKMEEDFYERETQKKKRLESLRDVRNSELFTKEVQLGDPDLVHRCR
jgi:hypothetical protein